MLGGAEQRTLRTSIAPPRLLSEARFAARLWFAVSIAIPTYYSPEAGKIFQTFIKKLLGETAIGDVFVSVLAGEDPFSALSPSLPSLARSIPGSTKLSLLRRASAPRVAAQMPGV